MKVKDILLVYHAPAAWPLRALSIVETSPCVLLLRDAQSLKAMPATCRCLLLPTVDARETPEDANNQSITLLITKADARDTPEDADNKSITRLINKVDARETPDDADNHSITYGGMIRRLLACVCHTLRMSVLPKSMISNQKIDGMQTFISFKKKNYTSNHRNLHAYIYYYFLNRNWQTQPSNRLKAGTPSYQTGRRLLYVDARNRSMAIAPKSKETRRRKFRMPHYGWCGVAHRKHKIRISHVKKQDLSMRIKLSRKKKNYHTQIWNDTTCRGRNRWKKLMALFSNDESQKLSIADSSNEKPLSWFKYLPLSNLERSKEHKDGSYKLMSSTP